MREYARLQAAILLRRLAFEVSHTAQSGDAGAVHDLRVAIRRFARCLRVFSRYFPSAASRRVKRRLERIMDAAGAVRDFDIAVEILEDAGLKKSKKETSVAERAMDERRKNLKKLQQELEVWRQRGMSKKWRRSLGLSA